MSIIKKTAYIIFVIVGYLFFALAVAYAVDYFFLRDGYVRGELVDLGDGYTLYAKEPNRIYGPELDIAPKILDYSCDERFVIVRQNLQNREPDYMFTEHNYSYPSLSGNFYWVIDKEEGVHYGPLRLPEFEMKCDSLGVAIKFNPKKEKKPNIGY